MILEGITLDDKTPFREWATNLLPWLNGAMHDVAAGLSGDVGELLERQERYTGYAGRLVELYAEAEVYFKSALADAMTKAIENKVSPSLVARIAEGNCKNEKKVFEAIHRLNSTLSDQLITIASRLKFEGHLHPGGAPGKGKDLPF